MLKKLRKSLVIIYDKLRYPKETRSRLMYLGLFHQKNSWDFPKELDYEGYLRQVVDFRYVGNRTFTNKNEVVFGPLPALTVVHMAGLFDSRFNGDLQWPLVIGQVTIPFNGQAKFAADALTIKVTPNPLRVDSN